MTATLSAEVSKLAPKLSGNLKINRKKQAVNNLVACLFDTVRMSEWEYVEPNAFKFPFNKKLALWLTPESVEVRKGLRIFPIGNGKDADRLFNNIKHAKAVIAKAIAEQDKQVKSFMEAFDLEDMDAELSKNDPAATSRLDRVDIKIKAAPASVEPAETSPESEAAAALISDEDKKVVLEKIAEAETAIKSLQQELGVDDDELDSDIFSEALKCAEEANPKVEDAGTSVVAVFAQEEPHVGSLPPGWGAPPLNFRRQDINRQRESFKSLQGRVLGIVDAAFADKEQRTAVKTLINKEFRKEIDKADSGNKGVSDES